MIAPKISTDEIEDPVSIAEWVKATGRSESSVYRMLADGTLPSYDTKHGRVTPRPWFRRWQCGEWIPDDPDKRSAGTHGTFLYRREI